MYRRTFITPIAPAILIIFTVALASAQSSSLTTAQIAQDKVGQVVELQGTVKSFQPSRSERAPNSFKLEDSAGSIRVAIWPDVFSKISQNASLRDGAKVKVKGKVAEFRGALEIHVNSPSDVQIEGGTTPAPAASVSPNPASGTQPVVTSAPPAAGITPIAQISNDKIGQKFTIQGTVSSARRPSTERAPYILKVKDATGSIDVVFWQDFANKLSEAQKPNEGDVVRVTGTLGEYRGSLQLKPQSPADIQTEKTNPELKKAAPSAGAQNPQAGATTAPAPDFSSAQEGTILEVSGKVVKVERSRLGQTLTINDGKQSWEVIVWSTASGLRPAIERVRGGEDVTLRAKVHIVDGKKILIVTSPEDVIYVG
ncbi:MAG: OB-fold nucleic acid binding domain-containing protein [Candidatus Sumerlaeaceae bacterium]|nr:OB-fold nucleic acid binding domain-containing protein [Candidatus Sumerlaeaceae bacterium]